MDLSVKVERPSDLGEDERFAELRATWEPWWQAGYVPSLWLEFDLGRGEPGEPSAAQSVVPVVCWTLTRPLDRAWFLQQLAPALVGGSLPDSWRGTLELCLDALPADAFPLYAYDLRARGLRALRLELFGVPLQEVDSYLARARGEGTHEAVPAAQLTEAVQILDDVDRLHLSFEVSDAVGSRIGLEGSYRRLPSREARWLALTDRLVAAGLCTETQKDTIFAWPGQDLTWVRLLSHFKLVLEPGKPTSAKVYLLRQQAEAARRHARAVRRATTQAGVFTGGDAEEDSDASVDSAISMP